MQVILTQDVPKLGQRGDVVEVTPGYARNYLIPKGLAVLANEANLKMLQEKARAEERKRAKERAQAEELAKKLEGLSLTIEARAGVEDKLYGSVTAADIAKALASQGIEIDKRKIVLDEPIKELGVYKVRVHLADDINPEIKVWVVKEEES